MPFNHDTLIGVHLAEELVNLCVDDRWAQSTISAALDRGFVRFAGLDRQEIGALERWAERLQTAFAAAGIEERSRTLNALLDEGVQRVHLAEHDGLPPHLHFAPSDAGLVQRVKAMTARGLATFAAETGASRMGACPRPGCGRVFADTSRNGRRIYCSARCGNACAVERYRRPVGTARP